MVVKPRFEHHKGRSDMSDSVESLLVGGNFTVSGGTQATGHAPAITTGRREKMTNQTTLEGSLLAPYRFAEMLLQNRVVMASMTRGRAKNAALVPTDLHVDYYRQRASAGLIMTEATWISREAIGSINVPGLFTEEQTIAWRAVTDAVHDAGGRIFAQLAHSGAVSHPDFFDGRLPMAPSAVNPGSGHSRPRASRRRSPPAR
jgi:2,4-dienoyl-CoA reductase-like NADH-dependent reductase (Old Yellow Enzyme family)